MARIAIVVIIAAIIVSIGIAFSFYINYQPNFLYVSAGEPIKVGPVKYIVEHIGNHDGDEKTTPKNTFFQVSIIAENVGKEDTKITGGQFYILDKDDKKVQPVYGNFSQNDLLTDVLKPNTAMSYTTQFDIPFIENEQYRVGILPTKEQSSRDIGIICVVNC